MSPASHDSGVVCVQDDESPVGPLKLQLPDLSQAPSQEGVTVVLEDPDTRADPDERHGGGQGGKTQESSQGESDGASVFCVLSNKKRYHFE